MSEITVADIKNRLDIVQVVESYGYKLIRDGSECKGAISATSKSGKSLNVNPDRQVYNDFAGHAGSGDVLDFIAFAEDLDVRGDFPRVLKIAAEHAGIVLDHNINYPEAAERRELHRLNRFVCGYYHSVLTDEIRELIRSKWGITDQTIDDLLIGWAPENCHILQVQEIADYFSTEILKMSGLFYCNDNDKLVDIYRGRIVFPYWKHGSIVYTIGRDPKWDKNKDNKKFIKQLVHSDKYSYVSRAVENALFGLDSIKGKDVVYVTEGIADAIALIQADIPVISPVTVKFKDTDIEKVIHACKNKKLVRIVNDNENNESGLNGAIDTAKALEANGIRAEIVLLPREEGQDKIDVAEYMLSHSWQDIEGLPGLRVWDVLISREPVPESAQDRVHAFRNFILNNLVDMDPIERVVFCREQGKEHYRLTKDVINSILKGIIFDSGAGRFFAGDGSFIPVKLSEALQQEDRYITTDQGIWRYHPDTGCYQLDGEECIRKKTRDALGLHSTEKYGNEVVYDISISTRVDSSVFDREDGLVNLQNGYIDIYTSQFFNHSPDVVFAYSLPFKYYPGAECPKFEEFLDAAGVHRIDALELFGYCLVPKYPVHSKHVLIGDGGNGKGTFLRLLTRFLGSQNTTSYTMQELTKDPYAKAGLYGKLANLCGDMPGNRVEDTAIIKSLSGEDEITARSIYGKPFKFTNRAKLVFSMNHMPEFDDNTDSTFRRLVILHFKNLVDGVTAGFSEDALTEELPGIFNQALQVLPGLLQRKKFSAWRDIEETRNTVQLKSNSVAAFLAKCATIGDGETKTQDAYTAYTKFCTEMGETRETNTVFGRRLRKLYPEDIQRVSRINAGKRTMHYAGLTLDPEYQNLSSTVVDRAYLEKHGNNLDKCDTDKRQSDTDTTQIKNPIFQHQDTELLLKDTDNSTLFNDNLENTKVEKDVSMCIVGNNVEITVSDKEKPLTDAETAKNYLCRICVETPEDSVLSVSDVANWIDAWEKSNGPIYGKRAIQAAQEISKAHKIHPTEYAFVEAAVKKCAAGRCVDCGSNNARHEETGKGYRCDACHKIYSNPPAVVIPEEISLDAPAEVVL